MKKNLFTFFLALFFAGGFCQNSEDYYSWLYPGKIKLGKLAEATSLTDIVTNYPQKYFSTIIDFVSLEVTVSCDGKTLSSVSTGEMLTIEQKNILASADPGSDIGIKIKFSYKDTAKDVYGGGGRIKEMKPIVVMVVPETEAAYPGGNAQLMGYLQNYIIDNVSDSVSIEKMRQAVLRFTVNEDGEVINAQLFKSSTDKKIDKLMLEAIHKMPKWNPAQNAKGIKVKQVFSIPVRRGGGC